MATPSLEFIPLSEQIERLRKQTESPINMDVALQPIEVPPPPIEQKAIDDLMGAIASRQAQTNRPQIEVPDFDESFEKYKTQLENLYGPQPRSNFFDLASQVGAAMLAADPTTGAFRSAGMGLAKFNEEERARRQQEQLQRRQIGLKAFELAKQDVDAAKKLVNEYDLLVAKTKPENKVSEVTVTDPNGLTVGGVYYEEGSPALLTDTEIFRYRGRVAKSPSGQGGVKVPAAGAIAFYQTRADAEKTVEGLGMSRDHPSFELAVQQLVPEDDALVGERIISGGKYLELRPYVIDDQVSNIFLSPITGGETRFATYADARLKEIAKKQSDFAGLQLSTIPQVERALELLLETETGRLTEITFNVRRLFKQVFGTIDPSIANLESLVAISNQLAPKMRPVGSGSTSDMEFQAYKDAILSLGNTPEANYIALYVFKRMTENSIANNRAEQEALSTDQYRSQAEVNDFLDQEVDKGIFEKFTGDSNDNQQIESFLENLPRGAVFLNRDSQGRPLALNDANGNDISDQIYVIKGFNFTESKN